MRHPSAPPALRLPLTGRCLLLRRDPPIPGNPCRYDPELVVSGSDDAFFNATTGSAPDEKQMAAFIHHNGPVAGIGAQGAGALGLHYGTSR